MPIPFNPPEGLIQAYINRPQPAEIANQGIQQAIQAYIQQKQLEEKSQQNKLDSYVKAFEAGGPQFATDIASRTGLKNPPTLPGSIPPPQVSTGTATAGTPDASGSPIIAHFQSLQAPQAQSSSQTPPGLENPTDLLNQGAYGMKKLAAGEALGKYQDAMSSAEEKGPKSFEYARAFVANAGAPKAADSFIALAQQEGRNSLTKREIDDLKNSIGARAQEGRGQYFQGMLGINNQKFQNQLQQEANKALNPNVAGGALKPQQERLNRIGRAEALVGQMKSQAGGGDTRQMQELATSLASVLTGGNVVAQQQIEELVPTTYKGNINKFLEKLSNNPTGLEQQAFVTRLADTLKREKGTINTQIRGAQTAALPALSVLKQRNPTGYKNIVDANMNNPQYQTEAPAISSKDEYDALPSGSQYNWNGRTGTKP